MKGEYLYETFSAESSNFDKAFTDYLNGKRSDHWKGEDLEVEVPDDYLETLPDNTPVKIEVGAIGFDDNATFSEEGDICVNETEENGCGFDDDDDEEEDE